MKPILSTISAICLAAALCAPGTAHAKGVVLNFTDVDISTMAKLISDLTGKNFLLDERVKGKISIYAPGKLTSDEAYNVFTSVLELKGFTAVPAGKALKIVPTSLAKQSGIRLVPQGEKGAVNESYQARVIELAHLAPQEAASLLQPLVSKDGQVSPLGQSNKLLLVDTALNIQKLTTLVAAADIDRVREQPELVQLRYASADSVAAAVREWLSGRNNAKAGQVSAPESAAVADSRLNAVILFGSSGDKRDAKRLIELIDVPASASGNKVNVYYLENAEAVEVAKVLEGVVKGGNATQGGPGTPPPGGADGGKVSITPDRATNSLVITASPADYQNMVQVIQKLDRRCRQVFVQAMIAEVSLNKAQALGLQWGFLGAAGKGSVATVASFDPFGTITGLGGTVAALSTAGISAGSLSLLGSGANFPATLQALQSNGALDVLSTPNIMTSDNKEAEITVGDTVPFLSGTNLTSTGLSQQSIERKDVGIMLKIKPQISEGDYIKLEIYQEISAVKDFGTATNPNLGATKRSAKTSVVVRNSDTVVIAGLIQDKDQVTESKIPLLGDIPGLGWLFKTKNTTREKTNLLIMLTPKIIKDAKDMAAASSESRIRFTDDSGTDRPLDVRRTLATGNGTRGAAQQH